MIDINPLFEQHFGASANAFTVRAPGRVNLIGEHVDYNDGFVLPMAIPMSTLLRVRPRGDRQVILYAANFDDWRQFSLDHLNHQHAWIDYVQGVAKELAGASVTLHGFEGVVTSDVPIASGLSSSASIEVAAGLAFTHLAEQPMAAPDLALLCQAAENKFIGVNSGIMDQMAVAACHRDHALLLDCRSLAHEQVPFVLANHTIIVTDSRAPRELASSAYNERRAQCEEGVRLLQTRLPHITSLRDVSEEELAENSDALPPVVLKRVQHVVDEIARTISAVQSLKANDLTAFGARMQESHASLRDLYEVTSPELDWLTDWSNAHPGVLGSRMTGAGFGGCTVTLIENGAVEDYVARLPKEYEQALGREAKCLVCTASEGAQVLTRSNI